VSSKPDQGRLSPGQPPDPATSWDTDTTFWSARLARAPVDDLAARALPSLRSRV